ncbi:MAG: hypothetical protein IH840_14370 [Candidatus Heimdallarchaeota archaeon]|nr:hypothetical protein [Candidatus Heimdallarchaeota archaeon]
MGSLLGAAQHYLSNNKKRFSYLLVDIEVIVQTLQEHYPLYFNLKNTRQGSETDFSGLLSTSKETIKLNMTPNRSITSQQLSALQEPPKPDCKSKETIKLLTTLAIQKLVVKCNCRANACFHNGQYNLALQILRAAGLDPKKLLTKFNP